MNSPVSHSKLDGVAVITIDNPPVQPTNSGRKRALLRIVSMERVLTTASIAPIDPHK